MPDDDTIPLNGIPVRVFGNLLQQAIDHMQMTRGDYATFVVVGTQAVSVYTGTKPRQRLITHETTPEPPVMRQGATTARSHHAKQKQKQKGKRRQHGSFLDVDIEQITGYFTNDPNRQVSALMVGDLMKLPRASAERQNLSRVLAEMRLSGIIRPTSDSRIPFYVLDSALPRVQVGRDITEDNVERLLEQAGRPLAFGIIGDLMQIRRSDRIDRVALAGVLRAMANEGKVRHQSSDRENIAIYRVA